jgi:AcrR family transcriptional regulator
VVAPGRTATRRSGRRQQIIEVAADRFRTSGYHNVGINDIAEDLGLTGPALYRHFRNKQELLLATVENAVDGFVAAYAQPHQDLRELLDALAGAALESRFSGVLWQREAVHLPKDQRHGLELRFRDALRPLRLLIAQHRPDLDASDIDLLLWACQAILASVGYHTVKLDASRTRSVLAGAATAVCDSPALPASGPGRPTPTPVQRLLPASRREAAIVAAARLFAERGYQAVTIDDIGAAAGIAGPSLYHHFPSKSAILIAQLTRCLDSMMFDLWAALDLAGDAEEALRLVLVSVVRTNLEHGIVMGALINEMVYVPAGERLELRRVQHDYTTEWVALLTGFRPELSDGEAQVLVEATHAMIGLLCRVPGYRRRPAFADELLGLGASVLGLG